MWIALSHIPYIPFVTFYKKDEITTLKASISSNLPSPRNSLLFQTNCSFSISDAFKCIGHLQDSPVLKMAPNDLHADRQPLFGVPRVDGEGRVSCDIALRGVGHHVPWLVLELCNIHKDIHHTGILITVTISAISRTSEFWANNWVYPVCI